MAKTRAREAAAAPAPEAPAADEKTVRITCDPDGRLERVPIGELIQFQAEIKVLTEDGYRRARESILQLGYSFPTMIWHGHREIIDGHQRNLTVMRMIEQEGYRLGEDGRVPVVSVMAKDRSEAKLKVLAAASVYGQLDILNLEAFTADLPMDFSDLTFLALPGFDEAAFFRLQESGGRQPPENFPEVDESIATEHECPKCGYSWSGKSK